MDVIAAGRAYADKNHNNPFSYFSVPITGLLASDVILLTPHVSHGNLAPDNLGPLFYAYVTAVYLGGGPQPGSFEGLVYDMGNNGQDIGVHVDYMVMRP